MSKITIDVNLAPATDRVTLDVPLLIRTLEWARETAKTDDALHDLVERMLSLGQGAPLTMSDARKLGVAA